MRILILTQYYPPENVFYPNSLAVELADRGHSVQVLTGYPNYPKGKLYEGYNQKWRSKEIVQDHIQVLRVPIYIDHSPNPLRRVMNYLSFGISAATAYGWSRDVDIIYVYAPQMTAALGPWMWRLIGGAPYVLHVQDLWPDSITGSSLIKRGFSAKAIGAILQPWIRSIYRRSAAVIGIAPTMVNTLIQRGVDPSKAHLIYNWAAEISVTKEQLPEMDKAALSPGIEVLYGGNVGDMQDLNSVVRAAHQAQDSGVHLTIVGDGIALPGLQKLVQSLGSTNIDFVGRVSREEMKEFYRNSDFSMVCLKDLPNFRGTVPSKFQASLAHGIPVISSVQGDVRSLVEELKVGFTADAENVESLEDAFRKAAASTAQERGMLAERARDAYNKFFSFNAGISSVEEVLMDAAQERSTIVGSKNSRRTASAVD